MADVITLAYCSDLESAREVQAVHDIECGYPKRHTHTLSGAALPSYCVAVTEHAVDPEPILDDEPEAEGVKVVAYVMPMPRHLPEHVKAKVQSKTKDEVDVVKAEAKAAKAALRAKEKSKSSKQG